MNDQQNINKPANSGEAQGLFQGVGGIAAIYFIGIGGIGMSALARYFHSHGVKVSGYDRTQTPLTKELEVSGIPIRYEEDVEQAPKQVDIVVYTPAVPATHTELVYYRQHGYNIVKRSDVLKIITESSFNICVAGTHGKTTITSMTAHLLRDTGYGCNAFLGGIAANYGTNFWSSEKNVCVVEADEYDRSFLKLSPDVAIVSAIDPDHLDIYGTPEEVENAFIAFTKRLKPGGCLISKYGLSRSNDFSADVHITYSLHDTAADVYAANVKVQNGSYLFDVVGKDWTIKDVVLHMGGLHNIENTVAAITVAKHLKIDDQKITEAVASFKGVKRRFEYIIKNSEHVLIDDYAHHPEELRALITGVKSLFQQHLVLVFQPHLYSRTKDQVQGFAESLDLADEVILLPIYPARELPVEGVKSEIITERMSLKNKQVLGKEEALEWIKQNRPQLLVIAGAGDIDTLVEPAKEIFTTKE